MVNLRQIANRATSAINPNIGAQWRAYAGYTTLPSGKTQPSYAAPTTITVQTQALTRKEVEHLDALNLSACERAVYANTRLGAFDRLTQTGGDFLFFDNRWWLVMALLEDWGLTAGWSKAALVGQMKGPV